MTNKKIWLSLLSIALIVCMLSVGLISCKKDPEPTPGPTETVETQAIKAIIGGLQKSVEDGDMTDLKVDGELGIKVNDLEYTLSLNLDLALLQKNKTTTPSYSFLEAELKEGNNVLLGVYYYDGAPQSGANVYTDDFIYVQYKPKTGAQKKMYFDAPYVAAVQSAKGEKGKVDFSNIDLTDEEVWEDTILKYALMVAGLAEDGVCTDTEAAITLNLGTLLDPSNPDGLADLVGGLVDFEDLDLNVPGGLAGLLPDISLTLSAELEDGKVTGLSIDLGIDQKDIVVKNISNANHKVLEINISKDINVELDLTYTIGDAQRKVYDFSGYTYQENIIDVNLSVDLFLDSELGVTFKLGTKDLKVAAEPGYYTLNLNLASNPWPIIALINNGLNFDGTANMISSIKEIINVVKSLQIQLTKTAEVNGTALATPTDVLNVMVAEDVNSETHKRFAFIGTLDLVKGLGLSNGLVEIDSVIDLALEFIPKSGQAPASALSTADDDDNTELFKTIAGYLLGAYLGINDGTNGKIYASFDTGLTTDKMIPFSGYTKWSGATYNSAFKYYKQTEGSKYVVVNQATAQYDAKTTYYTLTPAKFVEVDTSKGFDTKKYYYEKSGDSYVVSTATDAFDSTKTYYTYQEAKYEEAKISKFDSTKTYYTFVEATYEEVAFAALEENKEYYVRGYNDITYDDKGNIVSRGDFGIKLSASVKVTDNIEINATVENMDIFGLPNKLSAKISNLQVKLWAQDFNVLDKDSQLVKYSTVKTAA